MTAIADLVGQDVADRLAALAREAAQRQAEAASAPERAPRKRVRVRTAAQPPAPVTAPVCEACGRPLPVPQAVFRSGAEQPGAALAGDPSRARA